MYFDYPCPGCRATNNLHEPDCRFVGTDWHDVEKAYVDVLSVLTAGQAASDGNAPTPVPESRLREAVHGEWDALHQQALRLLKDAHRVEEEADGLVVPTPGERREALSEPTIEPVKTIYEKGSVHGAHDNSVFALVAYYEMVGLSWAETKANVVKWLHETGTWARGGFEESSPEVLLENKRHVYEEGYGWKEKARAAKAVIDRQL